MQVTLFNRPAVGSRQRSMICLAAFFAALVFPTHQVHAYSLEECMMEALKFADNAVTVGQLREQCKEETGTVSKEKVAANSEAGTMGPEGPSEIILQTSQARKPAFFPHKIHQDHYGCGTCHHGQDSSGRKLRYDETTEIQKCTNCHNTEMPNEKFNGFQLIGHALCRECHRTHQDLTSATCGTCHRRAK